MGKGDILPPTSVITIPSVSVVRVENPKAAIGEFITTGNCNATSTLNTIKAPDIIIITSLGTCRKFCY